MAKLILICLILLSLAPTQATGATVYVSTKNYSWEWDDAPGAYQDFLNGGYRTRAWLEERKPPKLSEATRPLRIEAFRYFELEKPVTLKFAVIGPPRSTSGHDPYFFAWIEWVSKSDFDFDLDDRRFERKAGIARIAIEGEGERKLEIREWHWEKDLKEAQLERVFPWDAAVVARKMIDLHAFHPRVLPELVNGPGKQAPY